MDQLKEHPQIVELLDTLDKNGLMKEKNEVQSLVTFTQTTLRGVPENNSGTPHFSL